MNYTDGSGQMIPVRGTRTHLIIREQKPLGTLQLPIQQIRLVEGDIGNLPLPPLFYLLFRSSISSIVRGEGGEVNVITDCYCYCCC